MMILVVSVISVLLLSVICYSALKDVSVPDEPKDRTSLLLLGAAVLAMVLDCFLGGVSADMLMMEIMPPLVCMNLVVSSLWETGIVRRYVPVFLTLSVLPVLLDIFVAAGWLRMPSSPFLLAVLSVYALLAAGLFCAGTFIHLRNVRQILKTGTIWSDVGLAVDAVYVVIMITVSFGYIAVSAFCPDKSCVWLPVFPILAGGMLAALGLRKADDVKFVFWRDQERRIVESMKVTKVETAADPSSIDDVYQEIYERVVAYFDSEKPFLDNELTINDLVKVLYSNKLYISRAISQFTGRNFCQFVNYYRVIHSMEVFRNNPDLKIHELAGCCGFNSDVSYNMAFRLFMGETPGEWCRKERNRKLKMKK